MHFTLADLVTDITQNAVEAGSEKVILEVSETETEFRFIVIDNGKGMTEDRFLPTALNTLTARWGLGCRF